MNKYLITPEEMKSIFIYNKDTGKLFWKTRNSKEAGWDSGRGYLRVQYKSNTYMVHRIIWAIITGTWPINEIDHINGDKKDNRISNLRDCSRITNCQNRHSAQKDNKLGYLGVTKNSNKFAAHITINKSQKYLGLFETPEIAHNEYLKSKRQFHAGCTI